MSIFSRLPGIFLNLKNNNYPQTSGDLREGPVSHTYLKLSSFEMQSHICVVCKVCCCRSFSVTVRLKTYAESSAKTITLVYDSLNVCELSAWHKFGHVEVAGFSLKLSNVVMTALYMKSVDERTRIVEIAFWRTSSLWNQFAVAVLVAWSSAISVHAVFLVGCQVSVLGPWGWQGCHGNCLSSQVNISMSVSLRDY